MKDSKNLLTLIQQDKSSKKIVSVKSGLFKDLDFENQLYVDCDLDSVLEIGNFDEVDLNEIQSKEGIQFLGLLPVVTVDTEGKVLMLAFLNLEALTKTFETGFATYFSRSRNKIWLKGESSDNKQLVKTVYFQQESSFFVYEVSQKLAACHEGFYSCFFRKLEVDGSFTQIDFDRKFQPEKVYG